MKLRSGSLLLSVALAGATALLTTGNAGAAGGPASRPSGGVVAQVTTQVSTDPFTNTSSQHATEVEPDTFSVGDTIVSAFQVGRFTDGGASDLGWATSTDGGVTWSHGFLPGLTVFQGGGPFARASDPAVVFDARHGIWMINGLGINSSVSAVAVTVSRSTDALTWQNPVVAFGNDGRGFDKNWITCDNTPTSAFFGNCYIEADITSSGNAVVMSTSHDGGLTWSRPLAPSGGPRGLGGQPVVQPNGTVVVPYSTNFTSVRAFTSADGGASWSSTVLVSSSSDHAVVGMRTEPLPSAEVDAAGRVYVAWQDCRFRASCTSNDIVLSTSADGRTWSTVRRVPIDATTSTVDHFIPGLGVDHATSGSTAHLGLYYYFFPNASCTTSTCQLEVGFVSSADGGTTWSAPVTLAGPMSLSQIAQAGGAMVGDYISCSFSQGRAVSVFSVAVAPTGTKQFDQGMSTAGGLTVTGGALAASTRVGSTATAPRVHDTLTAH